MSLDEKNNLESQQESNFGIPENYFDRSARAIRNRLDWMEEHTEFKGLQQTKQMGKSNLFGFTVPSNYFENQQHLTEKIVFSNLSALKNSSVFQTPDNYWSNSKPNFIVSAKAVSIHKNKTLPKNDSAHTAKIHSLYLKPISLAMAAMFLVVIGIWLLKLKTIHSETYECKTIACLEEQTVLNNLNNFNLENEELYELVDPAELQNELSKTVSFHSRNDSMKNASEFKDSEQNK